MAGSSNDSAFLTLIENLGLLSNLGIGLYGFIKIWYALNKHHEQEAIETRSNETRLLIVVTVLKC